MLLTEILSKNTEILTEDIIMLEAIEDMKKAIVSAMKSETANLTKQPRVDSLAISIYTKYIDSIRNKEIKSRTVSGADRYFSDKDAFNKISERDFTDSNSKRYLAILEKNKAAILNALTMEIARKKEVGMAGWISDIFSDKKVQYGTPLEVKEKEAKNEREKIKIAKAQEEKEREIENSKPSFEKGKYYRDRLDKKIEDEVITKKSNGNLNFKERTKNKKDISAFMIAKKNLENRIDKTNKEVISAKEQGKKSTSKKITKSAFILNVFEKCLSDVGSFITNEAKTIEWLKRNLSLEIDQPTSDEPRPKADFVIRKGNRGYEFEAKKMDKVFEGEETLEPNSKCKVILYSQVMDIHSCLESLKDSPEKTKQFNAFFYCIKKTFSDRSIELVAKTLEKRHNHFVLGLAVSPSKIEASFATGYNFIFKKRGKEENLKDEIGHPSRWEIGISRKAKNIHYISESYFKSIGESPDTVLDKIQKEDYRLKYESIKKVYKNYKGNKSKEEIEKLINKEFEEWKQGLATDKKAKSIQSRVSGGFTVENILKDEKNKNSMFKEMTEVHKISPDVVNEEPNRFLKFKFVFTGTGTGPRELKGIGEAEFDFSQKPTKGNKNNPGDNSLSFKNGESENPDVVTSMRAVSSIDTDITEDFMKVARELLNLKEGL